MFKRIKDVIAACWERIDGDKNGRQARALIQGSIVPALHSLRSFNTKDRSKRSSRSIAALRSKRLGFLGPGRELPRFRNSGNVEMSELLF